MQIYSDGSCKGNGKETNIGGNGFLVVENDVMLHSQVKVNKDTTNNREELKGLINALEWCKLNGYSGMEVYTDSNYCKDGITSWIKTWLRNNWRTSTNKPVMNKDLWEVLLALKLEVQPSFKWIKGHQSSGNWNDKIDDLINKQIKDSQR